MSGRLAGSVDSTCDPGSGKELGPEHSSEREKKFEVLENVARVFNVTKSLEWENRGAYLSL